MQVWPFLVLTIGLLVGVGYLVANTEKSVVMQNWPQMRCTPPILFAGSFFKPSNDKRSAGEFAMDNFEFCMKSLVDDVMAVVMAPLFAIFGKHASMAEMMTETMNAIRKIMHAIYEAFLSFIEPFLKKFESVAYQVGIVTQRLRMVFQRVNAMMLGMLFSGLSIVRGFMNTIDFVIKVVMIIVGIMVALIILLFFILFPFIPLIVAVLTAVVAVAVGSVAAVAASSMGTFKCFPGSALVVLQGGVQRPAAEVRVGDVLVGGGKVEATMVLDGKGEALWDLEGVLVAGSHRVAHPELGWPLVEKDPRAKRTAIETPFLYCFTTSDRKIPVFSPTLGREVWFRDWEEIDCGDKDTEAAWDRLVQFVLNGHFTDTEGLDDHLLGQRVQVITPSGARAIEEIRIGDVVVGEGLRPTRVIGVVRGQIGCEGAAPPVAGSRWWSGCLARHDDWPAWERVRQSPHIAGAHGRHLFTESGTFLVIAPDTGKLTAVRDYTEVGAEGLPHTYTFIEERIRGSGF